MIPQSLLNAYQKTHYNVYLSSDENYTISVGECSPQTDQLCAQFQVNSWVFFTACNPQSVQQSHAQNRQAMNSLLNQLEQDEQHHIRAEGRAEADDWPPEQSVLLIGANREYGLMLGLQFCQNAFVYGERGEKAELVEVQQPESPCVRNCCLNDEDICIGCCRSLDEIKQWLDCDDVERQSILVRAQQRKISVRGKSAGITKNNN
jgi:uncharacterized protein